MPDCSKDVSMSGSQVQLFNVSWMPDHFVWYPDIQTLFQSSQLEHLNSGHFVQYFNGPTNHVTFHHLNTGKVKVRYPDDSGFRMFSIWIPTVLVQTLRRPDQIRVGSSAQIVSGSSSLSVKPWGGTWNQNKCYIIVTCKWQLRDNL